MQVSLRIPQNMVEVYNVWGKRHRCRLLLHCGYY